MVWGFETTMPATAITLQQAKARGVGNFFFFCQHITLIPTLRSLLEEPGNGIDAFLAPGHVSMVIGTDAYGFIAEQYNRPLVVAGFEPLDLLQGVTMLVEQKIAALSNVENQYRRVVPDAGNERAQQAIADVFSVEGDSEWRGLGLIAESGVHLTPAYRSFDAEAHSARSRSRFATIPGPAAATCSPVNANRINAGYLAIPVTRKRRLAR